MMVEFLADLGNGSRISPFLLKISTQQVVNSDAHNYRGIAQIKWLFPHSKQHGKFKNKRAE